MEYLEKSYTDSLENTLYINSTFTNVSFHDILMQHVYFKNCFLDSVTFKNVTAERTSFIQSTLKNTVFNDTNLYSDRFHACNFSSVHFDSMKIGCHVDFDTSYSSRQVFLENFLGQLSVIPGTVITALLLDRVGRVWLMGKDSGNNICTTVPAVIT